MFVRYAVHLNNKSSCLVKQKTEEKVKSSSVRAGGGVTCSEVELLPSMREVLRIKQNQPKQPVKGKANQVGHAYVLLALDFTI